MTQGDIPGAAVRRWVVGAVVAGALLAGCVPQEGPTPTAGPVPATSAASVTPTPSPTSTASAPVLPEPGPDMRRTDEAGAVAAAEYFMELYAYLQETGDVAAWTRSSEPECGFCSNAARSRLSWDEDNWIDGYPLVITDVEWIAFSEQFRIHGVQVAYEVGPYEILGSGGVVERVPPEAGYLILDVAPAPDGWRLISGDARSAPYRAEVP